jgi:formate--tetrahydrofolate ligase
VVGLGGSTGGVPRESTFVITAASEVMAIVALAQSREDLKRRLGAIVVAYDLDGKVVTAHDIGAERAMAVVLKNAIQPNLVQTIEHTPALVHAGPFANIAHGTSSIVAARYALKLADYVVTECGFGSDLGGEKFFDIVCRQSGLYPNAVVIVSTTRAIKRHGGVPEKPSEMLEKENMQAFEAGLGNLGAHIRAMQHFGVPIVVALNRYPFDTGNEIARLRAFCQQHNVSFAPHEAFARGGEGATELAGIAIKPSPTAIHTGEAFSLRPGSLAVRQGEDGGHTDLRRQRRLLRARGAPEDRSLCETGLRKLPVCIAKTELAQRQREALGAPKDFTITVTDARLAAGAGFMVIICGDMMLMPGLRKCPPRPGWTSTAGKHQRIVLGPRCPASTSCGSDAHAQNTDRRPVRYRGARAIVSGRARSP